MARKLGTGRQEKKPAHLLSCLVGLVVLNSCSGIGAPGKTRRHGPESTIATPHLAAITERVRVLLPQHDGALSVTIQGLNGPRKVQSRAGLIVDGIRSGPRLVFEGSPNVRCEGVLHPGRLVVESHPGGGLRIKVELALEDYIECVVAAELTLWSAEPAELEAQAIAARSYALGTLLSRRQRLGDPDLATLWGGTRDQAYRGIFEPTGEQGSQAAARRLRRAMATTRGQVLFLAGQPLAARFSAACGGHTADAVAVFPSPIRALAQLKGAVCQGCEFRAVHPDPNDPRGPIAWEVTLSSNELRDLARTLGLGSRLLRYELGQQDRSGRWLTVLLVGDLATREVPAESLRASAGYQRLRSTRILSTWPHAGKDITDGLQFQGLGHGHGVGLCQQGARDAARAGQTSEQILAAAYPGAEIRRLRPKEATL